MRPPPARLNLTLPVGVPYRQRGRLELPDLRNGVDNENRTRDLLDHNQALYPTELYPP